MAYSSVISARETHHFAFSFSLSDEIARALPPPIGVVRAFLRFACSKAEELKDGGLPKDGRIPRCFIGAWLGLNCTRRGAIYLHGFCRPATLRETELRALVRKAFRSKTCGVAGVLFKRAATGWSPTLRASTRTDFDAGHFCMVERFQKNMSDPPDIKTSYILM